METRPQKDEREASPAGVGATPTGHEAERGEPLIVDATGNTRSLIVVPSGCYLLSLFIVSAMNGLHDMTVLFFLTGCLATTLILFYLALMPVPEALHREAGEYSPGHGVRGRELFTLAASPLIYGLILAVVIHYILVLSQGAAKDKLAFFLCSCPVLALLAGGLLAPGLWVTAPPRLSRVMLIAAMVFGWLVNYWVLFFVFGAITGHSMFRDVEDYFLFILVLSAAFPGMIIYLSWIRAMIRLERGERDGGGMNGGGDGQKERSANGEC